MMQSTLSAEPHRRRLSLRVSLLLMFGISQSLLMITAYGHGYMTYPKSRAMEQMHDDQKAWPIAGIKAKLRREPCLGLKFNKKFTEVSPGPLQLKFLFPDGANHVGYCYAYLLDPFNPGKKVQIGEMMNCARSAHPSDGKKGEDVSGYMPVTIPRKIPCDPSHCVLQWVWIAIHAGAKNPEHYEHYDSCADLRITGSEYGTPKPPPVPLTSPAVDLLPPPSLSAAPPPPSLPAANIPPLPASSPTAPPTPTPHTAPVLPLASPAAARQADIAIGKGYVLQMIADARVDGGVGNETAIFATRRRIEGLNLKNDPESIEQGKARTENERGIEYLRNGQVAGAIQAFESAYQFNSANAEIIANLGYAHFRHDDPVAAEPLLLLALAIEPGRSMSWANLGQSYAKQGKRDEAIACLAFAYRFSQDRDSIVQLLKKMTLDHDSNMREAAILALRSTTKIGSVRPVVVK